MSKKDAPEKPENDVDARARIDAAESLRRQIELLKGRAPRSINEFAERAIAGDREKQDE